MFIIKIIGTILKLELLLFKDIAKIIEIFKVVDLIFLVETFEVFTTIKLVLSIVT